MRTDLSSAFSAELDSSHPDGDELYQYFLQGLDHEREQVVRRHVNFCGECGDRAAIYRYELASETGFDPVTGERFHHDAEWDVEGIKGLEAMPPLDVLAHAAGGDGAEQGGEVSATLHDKKKDLLVQFTRTDAKVSALVLQSNQPVARAEVRLELRGFNKEDRAFELFGWGITDELGRVDLGTYRTPTQFEGGHRFVLGVVLPEPDKSA